MVEEEEHKAIRKQLEIAIKKEIGTLGLASIGVVRFLSLLTHSVFSV
jgi:hypothetical protein